MQFKNILAIGDSFTYGEELEDLTKAWPSVLAKHLNTTVMNLGIPGSSNCKIVKNLVSQDLSQFDLVVIGWTFFDRTEVADEIGTYDTWPGGQRKKYRSEAPWRAQLIDYITMHHDDLYLYRQYLTYIVLCQALLKSQKKQYVMIDAFGNNERLERSAPQNQDLISKIDTKHFLGWPNESMNSWTIDVPHGPGLHFLDQGHAIVAEKIYTHLLDLN